MSGAERFRRLWSGYTPGMLGAKNRYAVLCPLVEKEDGLHFLLEVRAAGLRQGGEICFPGGRAEEGESPEACALRETFEELAIPPAEVELIGKSDFLCHPGNFILQPVLGIVSPAGLAAMQPASAEVAEVFTVPVSWLRDNPPQVFSYDLKPEMKDNALYDALGISPDYRWRSGRADVPVWHYEGHVIWGMTARILRNILQRLEQEQ